MKVWANNTDVTNTHVQVTPEQSWNLDSYLASVIAAGVRRLKTESHGYPSDLTPEAWDETLDKMGDGFERYAARFDRDDPYAEVAGFAEAVALFAKYFTDLWD